MALDKKKAARQKRKKRRLKTMQTKYKIDPKQRRKGIIRRGQRGQRGGGRRS
jgi:hypothetical protein